MNVFRNAFRPMPYSIDGKIETMYARLLVLLGFAGVANIVLFVLRLI